MTYDVDVSSGEVGTNLKSMSVVGVKMLKVNVVY